MKRILTAIVALPILLYAVWSRSPYFFVALTAIAIVLAQELGKVLNEPLSVDRAEFVESQQTKVYKF